LQTRIRRRARRSTMISEEKNNAAFGWLKCRGPIFPVDATGAL